MSAVYVLDIALFRYSAGNVVWILGKATLGMLFKGLRGIRMEVD